MVLIPFSTRLCSQESILRIQESPCKVQSRIGGWFLVCGGAASGRETKTPAAPSMRGPWPIEPQGTKCWSKVERSIQASHGGLVLGSKKRIDPDPDVIECGGAA